MKSDDAELVESAICGDKGAFATLVRKYQGVVYGLAYHEEKILQMRRTSLKTLFSKLTGV